MKLLAFKVSPIGDTVMFLPVIQEIKARHPDWKVTVFTTPECAVLFDGVEVVAVEREALKRCWRRPFELLRWVLRVRAIQADAVLLSFDQSSVARVLALASGSQVRIGGAGSTVRLRRGLTQEVPMAPGSSLAEWDWQMARIVAGGNGWPAMPPAPRIRARVRAATGRQRVVIHPGASRDYQRWPLARFLELASLLSRDFEVIWVGEPRDNRSFPPAGTRLDQPASLADLSDLLSSCELFVGNHSGPFHLASALGTPCVVPVGPTHPSCDPPWSRERTLLLRMRGLACMPCDGVQRAPNRCINSLTPMRCLEFWSVEEVERACRKILAGGSCLDREQKRGSSNHP